jgi:Carboxypeptidase regulatory-like domain
MRHVIMLVCLLMLGRQASAQDAPAVKDSGKASLEGKVVKEPGGGPVKKAVIELIAENQEEGGNYTATSDQEGRFEIHGIAPGRYLMFAERTGFIEVDQKRRRSRGLYLSFSADQELRDQTLHMMAAAALTGRVLDEDGDPMSDAEVRIYKRRFGPKGLRLEPLGGTRTNDLGEFRMGGLLADKYFVCVVPPVGFQNMFGVQKSGVKDTVATQGTYVTTFYPNATDRAQAAPIELHAGEETPVDFSLSRVHTVKVRGSVAGLPANAEAAVMIRGQDSDALMLGSEVDKQGKFEISHIAPGMYTIIATTAMIDSPLSAPRTIQVGDADIDGVILAPFAGTLIRGKVHFEGKGKPGAYDNIVVRRIDGGDEFSDMIPFASDGIGTLPPVAQVQPDGSFVLKDVPPGIYEVEFSSAVKGLQSYLVDTVVLGKMDVAETGLKANGGTLTIDVALSAIAGEVNGVVQNKKSEPLPGAVVVAVPEEKYQKRENRYKESGTDQQGRFSLGGLHPGNYTLYAWEVLDGDEYLDPDFLKQFEGQGTPIKVEKASRQTIALKIIPAAADPP